VDAALECAGAAPGHRERIGRVRALAAGAEVEEHAQREDRLGGEDEGPGTNIHDKNLRQGRGARCGWARTSGGDRETRATNRPDRPPKYAGGADGIEALKPFGRRNSQTSFCSIKVTRPRCASHS